jgi:hypothetical protein
MTRTKTFGCWLAAVRSDDPIGDLADDFRRDCRCSDRKPSSFRSPQDLRAWMQAHGACSEALRALSQAAAAFRREVVA